MSNKSRTSGRNEDSKSALAPKVRFPNFKDGPHWKSRELGPMTIKVGSGITPAGGDKNYKVKGRPFVRSQNVGWGELILDDVAFIDENMHRSFDSTEIKTSDVLLNITGASIGRSAVADSRIAAGNVNQHVCIIRVKPSELDPFLLNQYFISEYGQRQIGSFQAGGNRQGLNFAQIRSFLIPLSQSLLEQQKIADCLSSVDELIAAQARKVDALKTHKKGLMQQLFPREGETQPRLRLPKFQNTEGWHSESIGSIFETSSGGTPDRSKSEYWGGNTPWITTSLVGFSVITKADEYISDAGLKSSSAKLFPEKTILVAMYGQGKTRGQVAMLGIKAATNQACAAILPRKEIDPRFVFLNLGNRYEEMRRLSNSGGQENLSQGLIRALQFPYPIDINEQTAIATCLTALDDLISAQIQRLEALKTHKKGLMQQLFPSAEEVEG